MFKATMPVVLMCYVLLGVASNSVIADDACELEDSQEQKSQALLQVGASTLSRRIIQPTITGSSAPLTEAGYASVAQLCCSEEMVAFIKRVVEQLGFEVCHVGGLSGFILWYDCTDDQETLESMKQQLDEALTRDCPWLATPGNCKPLPPTCPVFPSATFPPCLAITSTTTTTTPGACLGKAKDIFIAIDASNSVKRRGWKTQAQFANGLVQALIGNGNPTGHRINVHWFNGITSPLTAPSQIVEPTGGNEDQTNTSFNANDIGTWISDSDEVPNLQKKIEELDYREIRHGATDHPQVYKTADYAFYKKGDPLHEQMLILITDGETHSGEGCGRRNLPDKQIVYSVVGDCDNDATHPCRRDGTTQTSCDFRKCICGLWTADAFKKKCYELLVVGIENGNQETFLEAQMKRMASTGRHYFAADFTALDNVTGVIHDDICK
jgi:hypothetical protein